MTNKTKSYLCMIGKTSDASIILTKGFAKQANELVKLEMAIYIPISSGGYHVALTAKGIEEYERIKS